MRQIGTVGTLGRLARAATKRRDLSQTLANLIQDMGMRGRARALGITADDDLPPGIP